MKSNTILSVLCLAPLALAVPIPFVLVEDLGVPTTRGAHHPPAPVALKPGQTLAEALMDAGHLVQSPINNRPQSPASTAAPSAVLAAPQPVATTYLLSLGVTRAKPTPKPAAVAEPDVIVFDTPPPRDALAQMQAGMRHGGSRRTAVPCYYAHLRREYSDMLVISLVATFLLIIVLVETWESAYQR